MRTDFSYEYFSTSSLKRIGQSAPRPELSILQRGFVGEKKKRSDHLIFISSSSPPPLWPPTEAATLHQTWQSKFISFQRHTKWGEKLLCHVAFFSAQGFTQLTVCQSPSLHRYREGHSATRQLWLDAGLERWEQPLSSGLRLSPTWQNTSRRWTPSPHDAEH